MGERENRILNEITASDEVLDIGCIRHRIEETTKPDWLHRLIVERAKFVVGVDILESEVRQLRSQGYNIVIGNAESLNLGRKFTVIVAGELIEHLSNPGLFLECANKHLVPSGRLILTTPNSFNWRRCSSMFRNGYVTCNQEHTTWFDENTIRQLLSRYNFKLDSEEYIVPLKTRFSPLLKAFANEKFLRETLFIRALKI